MLRCIGRTTTSLQFSSRHLGTSVVTASRSQNRRNIFSTRQLVQPVNERQSKNLEPPSVAMHPQLYSYLLSQSLRLTPEQEALKAFIEESDRSVMSGSVDQAQFFQLLLELMGAKNVLEVGTFRGYTTLAMALALPEDGQVVALDITDEYPSTAKPFWEKAGIHDKIKLKIGAASDTLDAMIADGQAATFDFAFIDADKAGYDGYYEKCLRLLRPGGLLAVDNVLWFGRVLMETMDADTLAIHKLNQKIKQDKRVSVSLNPIADGVFLCRKR